MLTVITNCFPQCPFAFPFVSLLSTELGLVAQLRHLITNTASVAGSEHLRGAVGTVRLFLSNSLYQQNSVSCKQGSVNKKGKRQHI